MIWLLIIIPGAAFGVMIAVLAVSVKIEALNTTLQEILREMRKK